jgi:hypothetical protein
MRTPKIRKNHVCVSKLVLNYVRASEMHPHIKWDHTVLHLCLICSENLKTSKENTCCVLLWYLYKIEEFWEARIRQCQSQWPRNLKHELSSPARTLGSCVRIPLEEWMSVYVFSVFVLFCVQVAALWRADPPSKEFRILCKKDYEIEEEARAQPRPVEPWIKNKSLYQMYII